MKLNYYNEKEITELLLYKRIIKVENDSLFLDDGTELEILPNEGCGGCNSGWYSVTELNGCDNAIMSVEFESDTIGDDKYYSDEISYKIFVYAEDKKIKILQVDGDDGNGYYGTGYSINVKLAK